MPLIICCNSRQAANILETSHYTVLKRIRDMNCSDEFRYENFIETTYKDTRGRLQPLFLLTKSGLNLLILHSGYRKSAQFKINLINRFNKINDDVIRFIDENGLTLTNIL